MGRRQDEYYTLDLRHLSGLTVGSPYTLSGSAIPGAREIFLSFSADTPEGRSSDAGSVTITAAYNTRMAETFQVTYFVSTMGSLTGSLDVAFDIVYP